MFELSGTSKVYGKRTALKVLDLRFEPGTTTVLIGPSGCGKSTILRLLIGLVEPTSGTVLFEGREVAGADLLRVRRRVGYVIQEGGVFPHLTARENVTLLAGHLGWSRGRISERLSALVELTHLPEDALDRYPVELSGGQRQRVSLMRALLLDPDVLLLDEPLGALDPMIRAELQEELRAIFEALEKTVVLVTHDLAEAAFLGDRIVLLRHGRVVQDGTIADLLERPADPFVTRFVRAQRSPLGPGEAVA